VQYLAVIVFLAAVAYLLVVTMGIGRGDGE
jgi:hypothetical protein